MVSRDRNAVYGNNSRHVTNALYGTSADQQRFMFDFEPIRSVDDPVNNHAGQGTAYSLSGTYQNSANLQENFYGNMRSPAVQSQSAASQYSRTMGLYNPIQQSIYSDSNAGGNNGASVYYNALSSHAGHAPSSNYSVGAVPVITFDASGPFDHNSRLAAQENGLPSVDSIASDDMPYSPTNTNFHSSAAAATTTTFPVSNSSPSKENTYHYAYATNTGNKIKHIDPNNVEFSSEGGALV